MRMLFLLMLILTLALPSFSQTAASTAPGLPKEPHEIFAAAAPFYDFTAPSLKPWHLKATYQFYDEKGQPAEQGTYEYWWASPQVYRSTWTRPGAIHTDWHTADGTRASTSSGGRLRYFERGLQSALFSPLPTKAALEPSSARLSLEERPTKIKGVKLPCISLISVNQSQLQTQPSSFYPAYCFDPSMPILRASSSMGTMTTEFNSIVKFQGKYLAKEIVDLAVGRKLFSAKVDSVGGLDPNDPALTPPPDATQTKVDNPEGGAGVAVGQFMKKQTPIYPLAAKAQGQQGTVILGAIIGVDGTVHDLEVVFAPYELLGAAALEAVSHWEYKPYLLNGRPVEVETTINVAFSLGR